MRDPRTYLWDMQQAASSLAQFTAGRSFEEYLSNLMLRSAVERQFEIIGEAMSRLARLDPVMAARISEHRRIIDFRNVLIHGYAEVNHALVWETVETKLPILRREIDELLAEA